MLRSSAKNSISVCYTLFEEIIFKQLGTLVLTIMVLVYVLWFDQIEYKKNEYKTLRPNIHFLRK